MASLNLAGKTSGYVKLQAPDDSSNNPTVTLPTESGELALKSDIGEGGGSGGNYTPEKMVWENKKNEREYDTVYTNDTDVPRYVSVHVNTGGGNNSYVTFFIDGLNHGNMGQGTVQGTNYNYGMFIVPAGSTYEVKSSGTVTKGQWHEARMPVAVGTGGKPVAFKAIRTIDQTISDNYDTLVKFDEAVIDTDNLAQDFTSATERGFVITKETAGLWHVDGSVVYKGVESANIDRALCNIYVNGKSFAYGQNTEQTGSVSVFALLDLKEGDVVELHTRQFSGSNKVLQGSSRGELCYMNAYKISGGSASGDSIEEAPKDGKQYARQDGDWSEVTDDSIWTEEGGLATYDGEGVKVTTSSSNRGITLNDGTVNTILYNSLGNSGTVGTTTNHNFRLYSNNSPRMTFESDGNISMVLGETAGVPNMHINASSGRIFRSTTVMYSAEEVDKKLAIKDKLIEKLSDRLDKLEKKLKK